MSQDSQHDVSFPFKMKHSMKTEELTNAKNSMVITPQPHADDDAMLKEFACFNTHELGFTQKSKWGQIAHYFGRTEIPDKPGKAHPLFRKVISGEDKLADTDPASCTFELVGKDPSFENWKNTVMSEYPDPKTDIYQQLKKLALDKGQGPNEANVEVPRDDQDTKQYKDEEDGKYYKHVIYIMQDFLETTKDFRARNSIELCMFFGPKAPGPPKIMCVPAEILLNDEFDPVKVQTKLYLEAGAAQFARLTLEAKKEVADAEQEITTAKFLADKHVADVEQDDPEFPAEKALEKHFQRKLGHAYDRLSCRCQKCVRNLTSGETKLRDLGKTEEAEALKKESDGFVTRQEKAKEAAATIYKEVGEKPDEGEHADFLAETNDPFHWACQAYQVGAPHGEKLGQSYYDRVAKVKITSEHSTKFLEVANRLEEYIKIVAEHNNKFPLSPRHWADEAFQIQGKQEDYDAVMKIVYDDPKDYDDVMKQREEMYNKIKGEQQK